MLRLECVRNHRGIEHKYILTLNDEKGEPVWNMYLLEPDYDNLIDKKNAPDEKKIKKFFGWKMTENEYPDDYEIVFSKMKEEVFSILSNKFSECLKDVREAKK